MKIVCDYAVNPLITSRVCKRTVWTLTFPYPHVSSCFLNAPLLWSGCGSSLILLAANICSKDKNTAPCIVNNPIHPVWDQATPLGSPFLFQKEFSSSCSPHNCVLEINSNSVFSCKLKRFSVSWKFSFGVSVAHMPQAWKGLADKYFIMHAKKYLLWNFRNVKTHFHQATQRLLQNLPSAEFLPFLSEAIEVIQKGHEYF